jgi:hypothetical protein
MSHCSIASVKEPLHPLTLPDRTFPYFPAAPGPRANRFLRDSTQGTPRKRPEGALLHGGAFATGVLAGNERPARREQDRHLPVLRGLDPVAPVRLGAVERGIGGNAVRDRAAVKSGGLCRRLTRQRDEQILDRDRLRNEVLLPHVLDQGLQGRAICLNPVGPGVAAEHLVDLLDLSHEPRQHRGERAGIAHAGERTSLGFDECLVEAPRNPSVALV